MRACSGRAVLPRRSRPGGVAHDRHGLHDRPVLAPRHSLLLLGGLLVPPAVILFLVVGLVCFRLPCTLAADTYLIAGPRLWRQVQ